MKGVGGVEADAYEVLARAAAGSELQQIGVVFAANPSLAVTSARWLYDEEAWSEMYVVRRADLLPVESRRSRTVSKDAA